jgi:hypothetical protein
LNRLITTFDEVPPNRIAIHIASELTSEEAMVLPLKRVPPKSFVRSRSEKPKLFRSETRKDSAVHVSLSSFSLVKQPEVRGPHTLRRVPTPYTRRQIPNRFNPAVESLIKVRSIKGAKACLGLPGQCSAALSGRLIGRPNPACQRPLSTNRRIRCRIFWRAEVLDFSGLYAVLEPQSCDVLTLVMQ